MDAILSFINQPQIQYGLTLAGGFILKKWPAFNNKAIPLVTLVLNLLISTLGSAFGVKVAEAGTVDVIGHVVNNPWLDALATWLTATGTHGTAKNLLQWVRGGFGLLTGGRR